MGKSTKWVFEIKEIDKEHVKNLSQQIKDVTEALLLKINIPDGFVVTEEAYRDFLQENNLPTKINNLLSTIHHDRADSLMQVSGHIKRLILESRLPDDLIDQVGLEYKKYKRILKNAEVLINEEYEAKNLDQLLDNMKIVWCEKFEPKHILRHKTSDPTWVTETDAILVQKKLKGKNFGKITTDNLRLENIENLSSTEAENLRNIGEKIKKHFYLPYEISWVIDKGKIYVIGLKPMTNVHKAYLVLMRHGESVWNAKGLWTGWTDVELSETGHQQAKSAGETLKDVKLDIAFVSTLKRAKETLRDALEVKNQLDIPIISNKALNERNYGDYTGKNKWEIKEEVGEGEFKSIRRDWNRPLPNGESLKDVYNRVIPYFEEKILPQLKTGKNVILSAHGNSLRSLVKYLDKISDEDISRLEIAVGEIYVYKIDEDGKVISKEIRNKHENKV
jgi:2,3-bisphosphoglycerate-dependent phosphoglycerate mutase